MTPTCARRMLSSPKRGDCDVLLLAKIVAMLSAKHSAPQLGYRTGDGKNTLLFKWAALLDQYGP